MRGRRRVGESREGLAGRVDGEVWGRREVGLPLHLRRVTAREGKEEERVGRGRRRGVGGAQYWMARRADLALALAAQAHHDSSKRGGEGRDKRNWVKAIESPSWGSRTVRRVCTDVVALQDRTTAWLNGQDKRKFDTAFFCKPEKSVSCIFLRRSELGRDTSIRSER